jgi:hypothetical protein
MKFVIIFTIAFVLFIPVSVFAQTQSHIGTLYIEKDTFEIPFDKKIPVILSGNIKSPLGQKFVTLSIVNPDDEPDGVKIVPSSNGDFNHIMEFDSQSLLGTYNIIASYNGVIFENISFVIKDKTPSIEDILKERGEKIIKNEETPIEPEPVKEIPKDVTPTDNQKPVPNFADPTKDPQHYLDRYYNEDNYKEWFDSNYPDYTIEQAVGFVPKSLVPGWIKNISLWFGEGKIAENEFLDAISYLTQNNILQSQEKLQDKGNFNVVYDNTNNSDYTKIGNKLKQTQFFEKKTKELNTKLNLPKNIKVNVTQCNEINAFYNRNTDTILMCYEMYEYLTELYSSIYDDDKTIRGSVDGAMEFFFLHELGHALIDVYDIPITGMEEDAVDQLATIMLLQKGNDGVSAIAATSIFFGYHGATSNIDPLEFADEHSLSLQRFYNILCFAYGSNVNEYQDLIDLKLLPTERSIQCIDEYSKISNSWNILLTPYEKSTSLIHG